MKKCIKILVILLIIGTIFYFVPSTKAVKYNGVVINPEKLSDIDFISENIDKITDLYFCTEYDEETYEWFSELPNVKRTTTDISDDTITHDYYIVLNNEDPNEMYIEFYTTEDTFYYYSLENYFSGLTNLNHISFENVKEIVFDEAYNLDDYNLDSKYADYASYENLFKDCNNLAIIDNLDNLSRKTNNVKGMFENCESLSSKSFYDKKTSNFLKDLNIIADLDFNNIFNNCKIDGSTFEISDTGLFNIVDLKVDELGLIDDTKYSEYSGYSDSIYTYLDESVRKYVIDEGTGTDAGTYITKLDLDGYDDKLRFINLQRTYEFKLVINKTNITITIPYKSGTVEELIEYASTLDKSELRLDEISENKFEIRSYDSFTFNENEEKFELVNPVIALIDGDIVDSKNYDLTINSSSLQIKIEKPTNLCTNVKYNGEYQNIINIPENTKYHIGENENSKLDVGEYTINFYLNKDNYVWIDGSNSYTMKCSIDYIDRLDDPEINLITYSDNINDYITLNDGYKAEFKSFEDGNVEIEFSLNTGYIWKDNTLDNKIVTSAVNKKDLTITLKDQTVLTGHSLKSGIKYINETDGLLTNDNITELIMNSFDIEYNYYTDGSYIAITNEDDETYNLNLVDSLIIKNENNEDVTDFYNVKYNSFLISVTDDPSKTGDIPIDKTTILENADSLCLAVTYNGEFQDIIDTSNLDVLYPEIKFNKYSYIYAGDYGIEITPNDGYYWEDFDNSYDEPIYFICSIKKKEITLKANDQTIIQNGAYNKTISSVDSSELLENDYLNSITFNNIDTSINGKYDLIISDAKITNFENTDITSSYEITYLNGNLTINDNDSIVIKDNSVFTLIDDVIFINDDDSDLDDLISNIVNNEIYTIKLLDSKGNLLTNKVLGTDSRIEVYKGDTKFGTYYLAKYGDINKDGKINSSDLVLMIKHMMSDDGDDNKITNCVVLEALDYDKSGNFSSADIVALIKHIMS